MEIHWTYDGCDEEEVNRIAAHWERVHAEFEAKMAALSEAPSELRLAVEQDDSSESWEVQAALHLPGNTLVAEGSALTPEKALDQVLHHLTQGVDQVEDLAETFGPRREGLEEVTALLENCRNPKDRSQAFISFLSPLVAELAPYVRREIRVREYEGTIVG
jgi:hypothetical protein